MKLLLDTHSWLWWIAEPHRLSDEAQNLIRDSGNEVYLSVASCWEIAIKWGNGKLTLPAEPEIFIPARLRRDNISVLRVELHHALRVGHLPPHHKDPFDRMIIAQGQTEAMPILTADSQFSQYEVQIIAAR